MKNRKSPDFIWDIINIVLGIMMIAFSVLALIGIEDRKGIFTIVYVMGGFLNLLTGIRKIRNNRKAAGIFFISFSFILFTIALGTFLNN